MPDKKRKDMGNLNQEIKQLQNRVRLLERISTVGLVGCGVAFLIERSSWIPYLVVVLLIAQIGKSVYRRKLKQKEHIAKEVEERTREIRSERDAVQVESKKLAAALDALADAQDELVRQERMATVGQLTKGVVDRILNPLNYINNFANLTSGLANDLKANLEAERVHFSKDNYADSIELIEMMSGNLRKIAEHGYNTVRIVKAMEELLKERKGNQTLTNINNLCRIALDKLKKASETEIREKQINLVFEGLTLPLMMEVNAEQLGNVLLNLLKNALYAVGKKAAQPDYRPQVVCRLKLAGDQLVITIRDNGTGIDASLRDKIFAPFFTTKPTSEAAGVGLYLCREVVQEHRGTIEVESEKGDYTEFRIALPVYQPKTVTHEKDTKDNEEDTDGRPA